VNILLTRSVIEGESLSVNNGVNMLFAQLSKSRDRAKDEGMGVIFCE
jgi:hypothetical protein